VNDPATIALLQTINPDVVAVFSTRILKQATLKAINTPFINFHCGINPLYRGQFPLYWARALGDDDNVGVTIHLIDEGIDTGDILYQEKLTFTKKDISSFQFLQALPTGVRLMKQAIEDAIHNELKPYKRDDKSQLFYPPTLGQYFFYGFSKNMW
jgi:methionyl-tRNA formyltransferase